MLGALLASPSSPESSPARQSPSYLGPSMQAGPRARTSALGFRKGFWMKDSPSLTHGPGPVRHLPAQGPPEACRSEGAPRSWSSSPRLFEIQTVMLTRRRLGAHRSTDSVLTCRRLSPHRSTDSVLTRPQTVMLTRPQTRSSQVRRLGAHTSTDSGAHTSQTQSSQVTDSVLTSYFGWQILNHWTTREVLPRRFFFFFFFFF